MLSLFRRKRTAAVAASHKARSLARAIQQLERDKLFGGSYVSFAYEFKELIGKTGKDHTLVYSLPDGSTTPDQDTAVGAWAHTITVGELLDMPRDAQPKIEWERRGNGDEDAFLRERLNRHAAGDHTAYDEMTAACGRVWVHHTDWPARRLLIR